MSPMRTPYPEVEQTLLEVGRLEGTIRPHLYNSP